MPRYADILLPLPLGLLSYEVSDDEEFATLVEGECVAVQMGYPTVRYYTGIVWRIGNERPDVKRIRCVERRLYSSTLVDKRRRAFWEWIADYYMCLLGEVMQAALPSLVKPQGRSGEEFAKAEYTPATEYYITLKASCEQVDQWVDKLSRRAPRQADALSMIASIQGENYTRSGEIPRRLVTHEMTVVKQLATKGLIELNLRDRNLESRGNIHFALPPLTPHQQLALEAIRDGHTQRPCTLLHGVTGSGKTEVYIHLIAEQLNAGGDVLLMLPEIALTTQLIERMERIFGSRVTPYHSKLTMRRRSEIFMRLSEQSEGGNFVIGVRSAIFLPLNNLQLIIVDEEHDSSYKQAEPAPLYNARDCAHILAAAHGAKVVLGSATPSLESWTNAESGKFGKAVLTERFAQAQLPTITLSDTQRAARRGARRGHFNTELLTRIEERVARGEQSMLFQNRRGFSPYIECGECHWVARCPNCNVSLTMHKADGRMVCHYCDHASLIPQRCPSCGNGEVRPMGFGTEKIEAQLNEFIPSARTIRLDRDTANSPRAFEQIIGNFAAHQSDIMVGTQMIAKGLDFGHVTLVGILNADNMLNNPDFRAEERAYSLMTQVAGRAGRRSGSHAEVVIQTGQPTHRTLQWVIDNDYETMARELLREREAFFYPPYSRIIEITLRHANVERLHRGSNALSTLLREQFQRRVRGPVAPPIDRMHGEWIVSFVLKIESGASSAKARQALREVVAKWLSISKEFRGIHLTFNVDPQ
ncbi:MAG: primosomal protein N' [Rikenellaceae bacterium]